MDGRLTLRTSLFVVLVAAASLVACDGTDPIEPPPGSPAEVVVIDSSTALTSTDDQVRSGVFIFEFDGPPPNIEEGYVIVGPHGEGFLRRVTATSVRGSTVTLQTVQAALSEAVGSGTFEVVIPPIGVEGTVTTGKEGMQGGGAYNLAGFVLSEANPRVEITSGTLSYDPSYRLNGSFAPLSFSSVATGQFSSDFVARVSASRTINASDSQVFASTWWPAQTLPPAIFFVQTPAGPFPVFYRIRVELVGSYEVAVTGAVDVSVPVSATSAVSLGASYADGTWENLSDLDGSVDLGDVDAEGDIKGTLRVTVSPKATVHLYGVQGPALRLDAFEQLTTRTQPATGNWDANLSVGLGGGLVFNVGILDAHLGQYVGSVAGPSGVLWSAPSTAERAGANHWLVPPSSNIPDLLEVRVRDSSGDPVFDVPVHFAVTEGGGNVGAVARTDVSGIARTTWRVGTEVAQEVKAEVRGGAGQVLAATTFNATVSNGCLGDTGYTLLGDQEGGGIGVDDDFTVYLNGEAIYVDTEWGAQVHPPVSFQAEAGCTLRVVAVNQYYGCSFLSALSLRNTETGEERVLDGDAIHDCDNPPLGVFYDRTFPIEF